MESRLFVKIGPRAFSHGVVCLLPMLGLFFGLSGGVLQAQSSSVEISDITWQLGPNCPEFRKGGCLTILEGKLISAFGMRQPWGEMATVYSYDPESDWWSREPAGPVGQTYVQGTECGRFFYTIGGRSAKHGGAHQLCFRLESRQGRHIWTSIPALNQRRAWAVGATLGTKIYVFGGALGGHGPSLSSVEMWDTNQQETPWKKIRDIPGASRGWAGAAGINGKLYLIGGGHFFPPEAGKSTDRERLRDVWELDPATQQWRSRRPLPYRLSGMDCCVFGDRYLIVVGGCPDWQAFTPQMQEQRKQDRFHQSYYSPFVLVYDTATDQWQRLPSMLPVPTNDIRVAIDGQTLYALGGENVEPANSNTVPWLRIGRIQTAQSSGL